MSQAAARQGDTDTGHGPYPPRPNVAGSGNVFIDGKPAHRQGDAWDSHCKNKKPYDCHGAVTSGGSASVFVNGKPLARVGDDVSCGSAIASGSETVRAG
ncbi:PaaR repeat-containing protein [Vibrio navarrensis]|uniref:PAAR domain-containing protein n=1 Tax=Vibrio navarrensis TaxID=29495 RepID=UPI00192F816B|nr:PAAR domain-containing protein [Vibrio navarrensis]MBE3670927.1 PaaR repeat-containing protein [Vibrio navarrensis]